MSFEIVIQDGRIADGTGNPWYKANIGINEGKITKISRRPLEGKSTIDATELIVSPGFYDIHNHADATAFTYNRMENLLHMGLTTISAGQCGIDCYTLTDKTVPQIYPFLTRFAQVPVDLGDINWRNLSEWREKVEIKGIGANIIPFVGFGNLRRCVMGVEGEGGERYEPTNSEMEEMKRILRQQMEYGAFGLSTGLIYSEQRNSYTQEVIELTKIAKEYGGIYISHMRDESDTVIEACKELIEICETVQIPGGYSHHKAMFSRNWGKVNETMRLLDRARARGVELYADQYCQPFARKANLGFLFLGHALAVTSREEAPSVDELLQEIKNPEKWQEIKQQLTTTYQKEVAKHKERKRILGKQGITIPTAMDPSAYDLIVYSKTRPDFFGLNFREVAKAMGYEDFWDAVRDLYIADNGTTCVCAGEMCEEDIITILRHPASTVSTDGKPIDGKLTARWLSVVPHPRDYGVYAKVLGRYTREMKILCLEDAVRKLTALPAQFMGLKDRGLLREGYWADITCFNPNTVEDRSTFENPVHPEGIPYVLVNGQVVIKNGMHTGALPGKVLSHHP